MWREGSQSAAGRRGWSSGEPGREWDDCTEKEANTGEWEGF